MKKPNRKKIFAKIGEKWRKTADKIKEYEKITKEKLEHTDFVSMDISPEEYRQGKILKSKLLRQYKGKTFEEIFDGEIIRTKKGLCFCLSNKSKVKFVKPDYNTTRERVLSCLKFLYGIGDYTQQRLKECGYNTIADLTKHPTHSSEAKNIIRMLNQSNTRSLMEVIYRWFPKSDPLVFCLSGFHSLEDFVFLDIETMGLHTRPIILFGVASIVNDTLSVKQYLLRSISDEPAALMATLSHIKPNAVFITFNGKTFDIPYLRERAAFYRIRAQIDHPHFDLLHFSRRAWRNKLPDCRLMTIEREEIGIRRKDDVPGSMVPEFYATYLREDNPGPLVPIVEHNRRDVITLAHIFSLLWKIWR